MSRLVRALRLALPNTLLMHALEPAVTSAFQRALQWLAAAGAHMVDWPAPELAEIAAINAPGGFSPMEASALHRDALRTQRDRFDPRVAARIELGTGVSAADDIVMQQRRRDWIDRVGRRLQDCDAIVCPTVPITAPPIADLMASDDDFFKANALLLCSTLIANFLDGCAFSLPCHGEGELPVGLMLNAPGGHDAALAAAALVVEATLQPPAAA